MKWHKKKLTWQSVLNPFTKQVWLALIFTITVFGLIFRKFVKDNKEEPWTLRRTYWYLMTTLMYQGVDSNNVNRSSSRIAFDIWWLVIAILVWRHAEILTLFMAVQIDEPVPKTFDELAETIKREEYTCKVLPGGYFSRYFSHKLVGNRAAKVMFGNLFQENNRMKSAKRVPPPRSVYGLSGIENQGATCYLNTLLQTLLLTPEFR
ncbi:uncharacterized protein LOC111639438, partial [Centruroides sculpturatus]|uniref:uncharacterized protein LOC111639438 n=1 Tax=Centruroides sculpturatus TaxID=218467 RepID=UPI000C6DC9D2